MKKKPQILFNRKKEFVDVFATQNNGFPTEIPGILKGMKITIKDLNGKKYNCKVKKMTTNGFEVEEV